MRKFILAALGLVLATASFAQKQDAYGPDGTYLFAKRDTCDLYLDYYAPAMGSATTIDGRTKPTILWVFGGGFKEGSRNGRHHQKWFRMLTEDGYSVVSIDYRLGMKNAPRPGINKRFVNTMANAISLACEDLFSATTFLIDNADDLGIDSDNIVIAGSSAGAITVLQAEWDICNGHEAARELPEGFNYAGLMAFSGAIFSKEGGIKFARETCPMFLIHGTADKIVPYTQMRFLNLCFGGTNVIAKALEKEKRNYNIYRVNERGHEVSASMVNNYGLELDFLEKNVMGKEIRVIDATIDNPDLATPDWAVGDYKKLY